MLLVGRMGVSEAKRARRLPCPGRAPASPSGLPRLGDRFLTLRDTNELHLAERSFIARELRGLSPAERDKTIVCTRSWPTLRPWQDAPDAPATEWLQTMGSDLDELIAESGPRFWMCGHAHTTHQVTIGITRVASNPRAGDGFRTCQPDFADSQVVEL
jgi:hypothetical protein